MRKRPLPKPGEKKPDERKEKEEERVCIQCGSGEVEDEKHFLLKCNKFQDLRQEMMEEIKRRRGLDLSTLAPNKQLEILMGSGETKPGEVSDMAKKYIRKAMFSRIPTG